MDGVFQEVFQDPSDQGDIGEDKGDLRPCVCRDPDTLFPRRELELLDHVLDEFPDTEGFGMDGHIRASSRQIEQTVDQIPETPAMADGDFEVLPPFLRGDGVFADEKGFDVPLERGQRGAEVVRYVGDQFPPLGIDLPQRRDLLLDPQGHPAEGRFEALISSPGFPPSGSGRLSRTKAVPSE